MSSEDLEWYFFCPRAKKYGIGGRMNRSAGVGYWKTTGRYKPIYHNNQTVGMMKFLVFRMGRPPKGTRTHWIMHDFRLVSDKGIALRDANSEDKKQSEGIAFDDIFKNLEGLNNLAALMDR